jgi:Zn-dependent M16 (insulinase) family peptidase
LKSAQAKEDSEEALAALPRLKISDISPSAVDIPTEKETVDGVQILYTNINTNGINYLSLLFDATDLGADEIFTLRLLISFFEEVPTENYTALTLQNYIRKNLGNFSTSLTRLTDKNGNSKAYVTVRACALEKKIENALTVIKEVLLSSRFEDKTLLENLLRQMLLSAEEKFKTSGHSVAINRAGAYTEVESAIGEYYSGYEYYVKLKKLNKEFSQNFDKVRHDLYALVSRLFVSERMFISLAGKRNSALINALIESFPHGERSPLSSSPIKPLGIRREGILAPVGAAYSAMMLNLSDIGESYNGSYMVANSLLTYGHLWNTVRIQGGAYGVGLIVRQKRPTATVGFYSYRDPSPARSLTHFKSSAKALRKIAESGEDLTVSIIGAVGGALPLLSTNLKASLSVQRYLRGTTQEDLTQSIDEILSTTPDDLLKIADVLDKVCAADGVVIVADEEKLGSCDLETILKL